MNNSIWKYSLWVIAILAATAWLRVGWVLFYPYEPLVVYGPYKIMNEGKKVSAGGTLIFEAHFDKNTNLKAYTTRQFVNKFVYYVAPIYTTLPQKKDYRTQVSVEVPAYAKPGVYKLYNTYTYHISDFPNKDVMVSAWTEEFEVIEAPLQQGKQGPRGKTGATGPGKGYSIFGDVNIKK